MDFSKPAVLLFLSAPLLVSACAGAGADGPLGSAASASDEFVTLTYPLDDVDVEEDPGSCFQDGPLSACVAGSDAAKQLASTDCAVTSADDCGPNGCDVCAMVDEPSLVARVSGDCLVENCDMCPRNCNPCVCASIF